jgi:hypothetical protein
MHLTIKTLNEISTDNTIFSNYETKRHILNQDPFNNHRRQLIQLIIEPLYIIKIKSYHSQNALTVNDGQECATQMYQNNFV